MASRSKNDAAECGYSVHGRRPLSRPPGDIRSNAEADRIDQREDMMRGFGFGNDRTRRIIERNREDDPTIVHPLDDSEEYF